MWGDAADWCDFSGLIAERMVGATICCHPGNIRPSRFHARDYGLLTANAFAQSSFRKGDKLETTVQPGEELLTPLRNVYSRKSDIGNTGR